jgi:hypothetical protein
MQQLTENGVLKQILLMKEKLILECGQFIRNV